MAMSLEESKKTGPDWQHSHRYLPFGEKIEKISPVDSEMAIKKKETEGKIYSPVGNLAEWAKIVELFL